MCRFSFLIRFYRRPSRLRERKGKKMLAEKTFAEGHQDKKQEKRPKLTKIRIREDTANEKTRERYTIRLSV